MQKKLLWVIPILLILIQFIPVDRSNPPAGDEMYIPTEIQTIFERSCNDCHTNITNWPWYSYVAPVSFWIANHVHDGRKDMNFSVWGDYSVKKKRHKLEDIKELVEIDEMPLWEYTLIHSRAKLSDADKLKIYKWVDAELERYPMDPPK